jgi:hypothetical protein
MNLLDPYNLPFTGGFVDFATLVDPVEQPARREAAAGTRDFATLEGQPSANAVPKRAQTEVRSYTPTMRERVAQYLMGDTWSAPRHNFVEGLLGTTGLGEPKFSVVDLTPAGSIFGVQEAYRAGDPRGMALAVLPAGVAARRAARGVNDMASKSVRIYDPPAKPPRPFTDDYQAGAPADATGRLTHDIEGRPLTARHVVGRRVVGGADKALPTAELDAVTKATTGVGPAAVASREIGNDAGRFKVGYDPDGQPTYRVYIDKNLDAATAERVLGHEIGHVIDYVAGHAKGIAHRGLVKELKQIYNDLNNPNRSSQGAASWARPYRPQDIGYKGDDIPREWIAEAIRAYMTNPNYLKFVAPETAAAIRAAVNANPKLREIIQFNSIAAAAALPFVGARADDEGESWQPDRM